MSKVTDAVHRVMDQARGLSGFILLQGADEEGQELIEHVIVRRGDIQVLLAAISEKTV